jgi:hypothetical protein
VKLFQSKSSWVFPVIGAENRDIVADLVVAVEINGKIRSIPLRTIVTVLFLYTVRAILSFKMPEDYRPILYYFIIITVILPIVNF